MARTDTLGNFLTDIADSIRTKTGETGTILASEFDTKIESIEGTGTSEDLSEELTTYDTELTTQENTIDDILLALQDKAAGGGGGTEQPTGYIQDGLIALFDARDDLDENGHWNSQIGDDYFYQSYPSGGTQMANLKTDVAIVNNQSFCAVNTTDYLFQDYTIELVGYADETYGTTFFTFNKNQSIMINTGQHVAGELCVLNKDPGTQFYDKQYGDLMGKRFTFAISLFATAARGVGSFSPRVLYSINGQPWEAYGFNKDRNTGGVVVSSGNGYKGLTSCLLSYYQAQYPSAGEVNCIRVYNRRLSDRELYNNYLVDKANFDLDELGEVIEYNSDTLESLGGEVITGGYYGTDGTWVDDANYNTWKIPVVPGQKLYQRSNSLVYYYKCAEYNGTIVPLTTGSNQSNYYTSLVFTIPTDQEYEYLYTCFSTADLTYTAEGTKPMIYYTKYSDTTEV